jgi:hypothetical protein
MNGITIWRVETGISSTISTREHSMTFVPKTLHQSCQIEAIRIRANHGEARADHASRS